MTRDMRFERTGVTLPDTEDAAPGIIISSTSSQPNSEGGEGGDPVGVWKTRGLFPVVGEGEGVLSRETEVTCVRSYRLLARRW